MRRGRRPSDMNMEAGDIGKKMLEEPVEVLADQFAIFLRQHRIAVRG